MPDVTDLKLKSLSDLHLSDQALAELLGAYLCGDGDCDLGARLKDAGIADSTLDTIGIRYKEQTTMPAKPGTATYNREAAQADQLAAALERTEKQLEDRVWKHYEAGRFAAALKEAQTLERAAFKATDPLDQLGEQFLGLLREAGEVEYKSWLENAIAEMEADEEADDQTTKEAAPFNLWRDAVASDMALR